MKLDSKVTNKSGVSIYGCVCTGCFASCLGCTGCGSDCGLGCTGGSWSG